MTIGPELPNGRWPWTVRKGDYVLASGDERSRRKAERVAGWKGRCAWLDHVDAANTRLREREKREGYTREVIV